ncbi:MAG TPA: universal stress protein [Coleofasciculaceae cyanobacterium]
MKYSKILVALDRSPHAEVVFEQALELAKKEEASLMLFHCLPFESPGVGYYSDMFGRELINFSGEMHAQLRKEKEEARKCLASYCQKATAQGVPTEWDLKVGDAEQAILDLAGAWDADLVVLGRRGRRGLAEIVLGSVSNHVVHHVNCSVLVVQGINKTTDQISVATTEVKSYE